MSDVLNSISVKKEQIQKKLSTGSVVLFGVGAAGEATYLALFNTFITIFYNQIVGLSNTLIGTAIMLALVADAITDPLVGIISDKWNSKHGRRHPFLFVAPLPLAISVYFIFNPPEALMAGAEDATQYALFAWLAIWTILSRAFLTLYIVPHLALGGEMSKNQNERSRLFSSNSIFTYTFGAAFGFVLWSVFFAGERIRESDGMTVPGHLDPASYGPVVLLAFALILMTIWTCAIGTYKHVPNLSKPPEFAGRFTIKEIFRQILSTLKNRNYVILMCGFLFFMIGSGIFDTLGIFVDTYFWELKPEQIRWFRLVAMPAALIGALIAPAMMRKFDRKPVLMLAISGTVIAAQLVVDLRLLGLMPENGSPYLMPILCANVAVFLFSIGIASVTVLSMIGDVVDENELETGKRQEGLFYSARTFFTKASFSLGHFVAGVGLDTFVGFPSNAIPGEVDPDVIFRLGILAGPAMGILTIFSIVIYAKYNLDRKRHQQVLAGIEANKAKAQAQTNSPQASDAPPS